MAKLRKQELDKVKYISMKDFYMNLEKYDSLDDKLRYATRYILSHGFSDEHDYSFAQVVHLARMKIVEARNKQPAPRNKEIPNYQVNKEAKNEKDDLAAELFLSNPAEYIKGEAQKVIKEIDKEDITLEWQNELKENCEKIAGKMNKDFNDKVFRFDGVSTYFGVKSRMEANLGGKDKLEEVLKQTKPSMFSRIFATYSAQWSALEEAYDTFNSPVKMGFGKTEFLNEKANDYLKHKFSKWKPGEEIPPDAYSKLNKTEMAKVNFAVSVINAIKEQEKVETNFHSLVDATKERDIKYEDIPEKDNVLHIDLDELEFQNKLKKDTDLDKDSLDVSEDLIDEKEKSLDDLIEDEPSVSSN